METEKKEIKKIIESLNPNERKIIQHLNENVKEIINKTKLDKTSVLRALKFLENKGILKIETKEKEIVDLGTNGILYKKKGLPERQLLHLILENTPIDFSKAAKLSKLTDNEFRAALGVLKKKAVIEIKNNKIFCTANREETSKKFLEEKFIEALPIELDKLEPEQKLAFNNLKNRKEIIEIKKKKEISFKLTEIGEKLSKLKIDEDLIETLSPQLLISGKWKTKKFRRYDIQSPVPAIYGGKRHFVNQSIDYAKKIWIELGFKEMSGNLIQTSFWNFDALFQPQDHPARDMHDTFYIKDIKGKLPEKKLVKKIKDAHEHGIKGSRGWQYKWQENEAKRVLLRTHTTCLSAQTLYQLSKLPKEKKEGKFFAVGKVFRNETIDWSHGFEFYQTEGIVIGKDVNFRNLLGYLKEFYKKMGFEKIRFAPAYFPYTEPSVEINVFHPKKKIWLELGGSGIFRPEVTKPILGEGYTVLAWGLGFDRIITDYYKIKDLREMYSNNIAKLRERKWQV